MFKHDGALRESIRYRQTFEHMRLSVGVDIRAGAVRLLG
jgi:hypothetical protein